MLFALVAASLSASPVILFVHSVRTDKEHEAEAKYWTQLLAHELRRWGARVTTQDDLTTLGSNTKQQQLFGCEEIDCSLDTDILNKGEGEVSATFAGEGPYYVTLSVMHMQGGNWSRIQPWSSVAGEDSYRTPAAAIHDLVPKLIDGMRKDLEPGRVRDTPAKSSEIGGPPAASPKRCSATASETALVLAAVLGATGLRRRATS